MYSAGIICESLLCGRINYHVDRGHQCTKQITDYQFRRVTIDLTHQDIREEAIACQDMEDFLGGKPSNSWMSTRSAMRSPQRPL